MKKTSLRTAASAAACLFLLALVLPLGVLADDYPPVTGISVTPEGLLSWDEVPGTEQYWVGVNGGFVPAENGCSIADRAWQPGVYDISVEAYADSGSKILAKGTDRITFSGRSYAMGAKSALGGWWGTSSSDHIASVSAGGTDIPSLGGAFTDPGSEVKIVITPAEGRDILSAFLRYDDQNRGEFALTEMPDGSYEGTVTAPDAVWTIGINTRSKQPEFVLHDVNFGRATEGFAATDHTAMVNFRLGKIPLPSGSSYLKTEWIAGDASAFATDIIYDSNYAEPYSVYHFWVCPENGLAEGTYSATLALFYDKDGTATNWVKVDECTLRITVVKPGTPVTASNWWCTSGDYIESFELNGAGFSSPVQLVPGETASATVRTREGYDLSGVFLRYNEQNTNEGVTIDPKDGGGYAVSFTVPENDFAIGVNVKEAEITLPEETTAVAPGTEPEVTTDTAPGTEPEVTTDITTDTEPDVTTEAIPDTEPDVTTDAIPETEPDVTTEEPQETEADVTTRGSSDPDDDSWDIDPDEQQGGSIAKSPIPWIMLGLGIFVILCTVGAVVALIVIKKRGK
ncbi:MAG: hypothetical protein K5647_00565 [Clostridiales bacterium]|nr:hypothetical protein [Clostridiales bacterium]